MFRDHRVDIPKTTRRANTNIEPYTLQRMVKAQERLPSPASELGDETSAPENPGVLPKKEWKTWMTDADPATANQSWQRIHAGLKHPHPLQPRDLEPWTQPVDPATANQSWDNAFAELQRRRSQGEGGVPDDVHQREEATRYQGVADRRPL